MQRLSREGIEQRCTANPGTHGAVARTCEGSVNFCDIWLLERTLGELPLIARVPLALASSGECRDDLAQGHHQEPHLVLVKAATRHSV